VPLYEYSCEPCNLTFEVSRSFKDSDLPALCPMCDVAARKLISVPLTTFTRGAASAQPAPAPASASRWSHHGPSHGPGAANHSH